MDPQGTGLETRRPVRIRHPPTSDGDRDQPPRPGQTRGDLRGQVLRGGLRPPFPEPLPRWQDSDGSDLWATEDETRDQIIGFYRRTWEHSDATINELPIDAPGHVPWWPGPDDRLFTIMVHVLGETTRHAGHADILREGLDGRTGVRAGQREQIDRRPVRLLREDRAGRQSSFPGSGLTSALVGPRSESLGPRNLTVVSRG